MSKNSRSAIRFLAPACAGFGLLLALSGCAGKAFDAPTDPSAGAIEITTPAPTVPPSPEPTAEPAAEPATQATEAPTPAPTAEPTPSPFPGTEFLPLTEEEKTRLVNMDNPLPEGYIPRDLVNAKEMLGDIADFRKEDSLIQYEVGLRLRELFLAAADEGMGRYRVCDPYRTQEYQWSLWNSRVSQNPDYGKDPYNDPVGVMPGNCSEHCAGLAVDICSVSHPELDTDFAHTAEGKWLIENCHRFGFIFRYPADKTAFTGVKYEPWHIRYVGEETAREVYESGLCWEEYIESRGR